MDTVQQTFMEIMCRYLEFQTTFSLLFVSAIGSVIYYLWVHDRLYQFRKRSWVFLVPLLLLLSFIYLIIRQYQLLIFDLGAGGIDKSFKFFCNQVVLGLIILVLALITFFVALMTAAKK